MTTRDELITHLRAAFERAPYALAAWQGGSDATGRTDEFSDLDLQVVARGEDVERCFDLLHDALGELGEVELAYRVPAPTWHGFEQEFLRLAETSPHHMVDFVVIPAELPPERRFLEVERHGEPLVWFDRGEWTRPQRLDRAAHDERLRARRETLAVTTRLFAPLVTRAIARGFPAEAMMFYRRFALEPLVELLRMEHAPERFDFGMRYLDRDLPEADRRFVEAASFPRDLDDLAEWHARILERVVPEGTVPGAGSSG